MTEAFFLLVGFGLGFATALFFFRRAGGDMIEQQRSLSRAEDMRSMRVSPDPAPDTPLAQANRSSSSDLESTDMAEIMNHPEISAAIGSGHLITAIKLVRAKTGLGLKQAKKLVDLHRH